VGKKGKSEAVGHGTNFAINNRSINIRGEK